MRIPLSQLPSGTGGDAGGTGDRVWGISFWRWSHYRAEMSSWAPLPPDGSRVVSLFGELRGLEAIGRRRGMELAPFATTSTTFRADGGPEVALDGGVDLQLPLGCGKSALALAANPDFGQVEADPAVVNLTAFETFFPEKRRFFLEGTDIFRFGMGLGTGALRNERLFHSRRVGRASQLPELVSGWTDVPALTRIVGAAKVSGRVGGWSYGLLDAVTAPQTALFDDGTGTHLRRTAEPATNYLFGRAVRELNRGFTTLGAAVTPLTARTMGLRRPGSPAPPSWRPPTVVTASRAATGASRRKRRPAMLPVTPPLSRGSSGSHAGTTRDRTRVISSCGPGARPSTAALATFAWRSWAETGAEGSAASGSRRATR